MIAEERDTHLETKNLIWQCENATCNARYPEYVNGCPKCENGEAGGSYKVSLLNEHHPAFISQHSINL